MPDSSLTIGMDIRPVASTDVAAYKEQLQRVSKEFESILVAQMMRVMKNTVPDVKLFDGSQAMDMYEEMLDDEFVHAGALSQGFGFSKIIYETLAGNIESDDESADAARHKSLISFREVPDDNG